MTVAKRGPGRPPLDNPRTVTIRARFTLDEATEILDAANGYENLSEWVRDTLLRRARRDNRQDVKPFSFEVE